MHQVQPLAWLAFLGGGGSGWPGRRGEHPRESFSSIGGKVQHVPRRSGSSRWGRIADRERLGSENGLGEVMNGSPLASRIFGLGSGKSRIGFCIREADLDMKTGGRALVRLQPYDGAGGERCRTGRARPIGRILAAEPYDPYCPV